MNTTLLASIKWVISQHGEDILGKPVELKNHLAKHTKNEPKEQRIAFGRCIELGCYKELKKAQNENERSQIKAILIRKIHGRTGINLTICGDALDILDTVIFGNVAPALPVVQNNQHTASANAPINKIKKYLISNWKKPKVKWVGLGIAAIIIIAIIFNFASSVTANEIVENRIDERIEELRRITEHQEQIAEQLEQIRRQIDEEQNRQNPTGQNNTQQTGRDTLIQNLQNDLLMEILNTKREGRQDITGNIKILVFPTNYRGNTFRMRLNNLTPVIQEAIKIIEQQARRYNQNITIEWEFITLNNASNFSMNNVTEALRQYAQYRNRFRNFNHVITVYAIDRVERSYITTAGQLGRSEGHAIMWFRESNGFSAGTLAHEIFHAFGAEDLYFEQGVVPPEVERNFRTLLGNSIMIDNHRYTGLDPINAWLIGWNKNPEPWYAWFIDRRDTSIGLRFY